MNEKYVSPYEPGIYEKPIYQEEEESGFFNPDVCLDKGVADAHKEYFSIVLPPPNVTGTLHMGHASMLAIQDTLVRYKRMLGMPTLWIPGTDSAALATQEKVEKELLKKENLRRHDLGREEFLRRVNDFALESQETILSQVREMGSSLDWSRLAYTLDDTRAYAVTEAFVRLYNMGLIEKDSYIVNWDPKMQTTVSDDEVDYKEETATFYEFQYGPFVIGTSRPETKFGDKYVVMHPHDERYSEYIHGQQIEVDWINGMVTATIIKDEAVDPEFGTGVMTITPHHDKVDFEIARRHNLEHEQIIDWYGKLLPIVGDEFAGMKIKEARDAVVERLREKGLLVSRKSYTHNVAISSRGGGMIEPQIKDQWFVRVNKEFKLPHSNINGIESGALVTLKQLMGHVVKEKHIQFNPENFEKHYFSWIDNLHDWCISRQIWFGHRVPVWYREEGEIWVGHGAPKGEGWVQEEDTLDTWFSSGLWTLSTLGWPEETPDLAHFHPNTLLETGYDIIFFWVARMILMTSSLRGEIPFKHLYMHGMVRDTKGQKMSKSKGNSVDPRDIIAEYGADAVRMSLLVGNPPGDDINFDENKVRAYKKFSNKLWNIARFVYSNTDGFDYEHFDTAALSQDEQKLIDEWTNLKSAVADDIDKFRLYLAADKLYHYVWHTFADEVIESTKEYTDPETRLLTNDNKKYLLLHIMEGFLKALHPFMPFITSEIWKDFPKENKKLLLAERW
ncbi:MAG: valine--tRNA ligase [Patescibacteria group bacterium]